MPRTGASYLPCPRCGSLRSRTRRVDPGNQFDAQRHGLRYWIQRQRICLGCQLKFLTRETVVEENYSPVESIPAQLTRTRLPSR